MRPLNFTMLPSVQCETVEKRLIALLFYFELAYKLKKGEKQGKGLRLGVIRTHLTEQEFEGCGKTYPTVYFRVEDRKSRYLPRRKSISYTR
jgi:hypothetical protein